MGFTVDPSEKFARIALENATCDRALRDPVGLGGGRWVLFRPPLQLEGVWQKWLGSIKADQLRNANLWLIAKAPSQRPGVLDDENKRLTEVVHELFYGILLFGIPYVNQGFALSGANESGTTNIRQFGDMPQFRHTVGNERYKVTLDALQGGADAADGIRATYANPQSVRLQSGFTTLLRAIKEEEGGERLHQYVRSVEAIIPTDIGNSKGQFTHRCLTFVRIDKSRWEETRQALEEIYEIRSKVEHQNGWEVALQQYPPADRQAIALRRLRQAEALALVVYRGITTSPAWRAIFENNTSINHLWGLRDDERRRRLSGSLDLSVIK